MKQGIFDLNTTSLDQITSSYHQLQDLHELVDVLIDNNDYTEIPDGQTWIHHAWSGDMAAAEYYMPKGVPVKYVGYWFPEDGRAGRERHDHDPALEPESCARPPLPQLPARPGRRFHEHQLQRLHAADLRRHTRRAGPPEDPPRDARLDGRAPVVLRQRRRGAPSRRRPTAPGSSPGPNSAAGCERSRPLPRAHPAEPDRVWRPRWLWGTMAVPGGAWLAVLILVPVYVVLCVALGTIDPLFQSPIPVWNPFQWNGSTFVQLWHEFVGRDAFLLPPMIRTIWYTAAASALSLSIGYPVAYFVSRYGGRRKSFFLILLVAPFWISYMMRMLAWIDLLQTNGYVQQDPRVASPHVLGPSVHVDRRQVDNRHPRPRLRLHPLSHRRPLRRARPDRRAPSRRPRRISACRNGRPSGT